ncbi:MAG: tetratricopeptide repeat protein [Bdellovibrionaceae bacterium]|nr:tetratricopeptide repeat protein [Pseudobdellovibrionaceae bacterium]MBX3034335.1 tetratricopeptide repeat protein [Pseudobdellovibrionaceae bacterium]
MNNTSVPAKKRDLFQDSLRQVSDWTIENAKVIFAVLVVGLAVGAGAALWTQISLSKEADWQSQYFLIEKKILDQKQAFDEARQQEKARAANPKAAKDMAVKALPSGDLQKDYGPMVKELSDLIQAAPKTKAGEMAALNLAELQARYKQPAEAVATLDKVNTGDRVSDLIGALVVNMRAGLAADQGDCGKAIGLWEKIARNGKASFLHDDARLHMGLCYEKMNEFAKAEQIYNEIAVPAAAGQERDEASVKEAERSLRLLKLKKTSGS